MKTTICPSCKAKTIRKYCCNCEHELEGDFFKCRTCGEKTLEGFESDDDMAICSICGDENGN